MFSWLKKILGLTQPANREEPVSDAEERLERMFRDLERDSTQLVDEAISEFNSRWRKMDN